MKIYRPSIKTGDDRNDVFCRLMIQHERDRRLLDDAFIGKRLGEGGWLPFKVVRSPSTPGNLTRPLGDRCGIDFSIDPMVLSRRALEVLLPHIGRFGRVLPLDFDEAEYSLFDVTLEIDALDEPASDIFRYPDGGISRIKRHVFKPELLTEAWIFSIPQVRGRAFVTDRFVKLAHEARLTGFDFVEQWSDEAETP